MAIRSTGTGNYLSRSSGLLNHNAAYTRFVWFKLTADTDAFAHVMHGGGAYTYDALTDFFGTSSDGTTERAGTVNGSGTFPTGANLTVGQWYWVAQVRTSTTSIEWYLGTNSTDGAILFGGAVGGTDVSGRAATALMTLLDYNSSGMNGAVAYAREWSAALTLSELNDEAGSTTPVRSTNLFAYTSLDGADVAAAILDQSGNNRHWTANGTLTLEAGPSLTTDPTITGVSSSTPRHRNLLVITGSNFGASAGTVTLGGAAQAVVSWATDRVVIVVDRANNQYGSRNLVVTTAGAVDSNAFAVTLTPPEGQSSIILGTPASPALNRLEASPDLASGFQVAWTNRGGKVSVFDDATFVVFDDFRDFVFEVHNGTEWGAPGTQSLSYTEQRNAPPFGPTILSEPVSTASWRRRKGVPHTVGRGDAALSVVESASMFVVVDPGAGSTPINVSDTATGADEISIAAALSAADAGAGGDAPSLEVALASSDSGAGADSISVVQLVDVGVSDSGTGSDAVALAPAISGADSGAGSDAAALAASLAPADSGAGGDTGEPAPSIGSSDSGTGSDSISVFIGQSIDVSDSGTGSDAISVAVELAAADSGAGSDAPSLEVAITAADTGSGTDAPTVDQGGTSIPVGDSGTGADAISVAVAIDVADAGTGQDATAIAVALAPSDSGAGSDGGAPGAAQDRSDSGTGTDAAAAAAALQAQDSGAGSDALGVEIGNYAVDLVDAGSGTDSISVVDLSAPPPPPPPPVTDFTYRSTAFAAGARPFNWREDEVDEMRLRRLREDDARILALVRELFESGAFEDEPA